MTTRDDKTKALFDALTTRGEALMQTDRFRSFLASAARFHRYSSNNQFLIWLQAPEAAAVNSYKRWGELGRQVRKGEKAIRIIAPRPVKYTREVETAGGSTEEREFAYTRFVAVSVFAYEQTDPAEGHPNPWEPIPFPVLTGDAGAEHIATLRAWLPAQGITVEDEPGIVGAQGYYNPATRRIALDPQYDPFMQLHVLLHEAAHALHFTRYQDGDAHMGSKAYRETVAEAAAYIAAQAIGLDTSAHADMYVGSMLEIRPDLADAAFPAIQKISHDLIEALAAAPVAEPIAA